MPEPARMLTGNEACALGALASGMRFYAGYPITPSTEIAETLALELPKHGGTFIQMEDEIASIAAVVGASLAGVKSMTATSGPGFSLMQENLGYAAMAEVPCVVVDVMRGGPSTGAPTMPAQGDLMQARWGTHGDRPGVVFAPSTVAEAYRETVRAFNWSERLRTPVVVIFDEVVGHLSEKVVLPTTHELELWARPLMRAPGLPYAETPSGVPPMSIVGNGLRTHTTGLMHDETGFASNDPAVADALVRRLHRKVDLVRDELVEVDPWQTEDAEVVLVAYGTPVRACRHAAKMAREQGLRVGVLNLRTLFPFPDRELLAFSPRARRWLVVEMSLGQLAGLVEHAVGEPDRVYRMSVMDGQLPRPFHIRESLRRLTAELAR